MSLNSLTASSQVPFFPPGIASHKTVSSLKRPQNVKDCKKIASKGQLEKSPLNGSSDRRLSKSTPDLKICSSSGHHSYPIPKHRCDMGLSDHSMFKATPLPHYYSPDSLERNRSLFENSNYFYNTRSLDRVAIKSLSLDRMSVKSKSKSTTKTESKFAPDKPFYPPSKYPSIHDKTNTNLCRLLDARQQYKTPKSRRSLSIQNRNKSKNPRPRNLSMDSLDIALVPDLAQPKSKNVGKKSNGKIKKQTKPTVEPLKIKKPFKENNDEMQGTPEIGMYRQHNMLDLQDESNSYLPKQISASYYYPKVIPNPLYTELHDKMAQSLYNESSLAAKIHTGSLERASRNNFYPIENIDGKNRADLDESPTKSYSPLKQCNSFSQDSLDGNRKNKEIKPKLIVDSENTNSINDPSCNTNSEDASLITESKTYRFHSLTEENELSITKSDTEKKIAKPLSTISEKDKTSDELKKNELYQHLNSIFNNNHLNGNDMTYNIDGTKKENGENLPFITIPKTEKFPTSSENGLSPLKSDLTNGNLNSPDLILDNKNLSEDKQQYSPLDQYNIDRYINTNPPMKQGHLQTALATPNSMSIRNEFFDEVQIPMTRNDLVDSAFIDGLNYRYDSIPNWKTEECYCIDKPFTGEGLVKMPMQNYDHDKPFEIESTVDSTLYNSADTQISGLDYDLSEKGVNHNDYRQRALIYSQIPRIALNSDSKSIEDSQSEAESSLSGSDDTSYMKYEHNSMHFQQPGMSWVSSPELTIARSDIMARRHRRYLQSDNPLKPLCNVCHKPAYFMERVSINNIIFHKMCFLCRTCDTHLSFNNCIIHRRKPYCLVHAKSKIWKTVSTSKLNQIKERLDNKTMVKQSSTEAKQQKRVFYSGIKSAKDRFLQESTAVKEPVMRQPKRITPPRQGVTSGIIESEPKPRDPNIVTSDDGAGVLDEDLTRLSQCSATKERLAKFREMQEKSFDKSVINGDGGGNQKPDIIPVDTKTLRNRFLTGANDTDPDSKPRKLNPSEEIQELAKRSSNSVFENEPTVRMDVVKSDQKYDEDNTISKNKAKELKNLFTNYATEDSGKKSEKFQMDIGEGGIYESKPKERNEDIVPSDSNTDVNLPSDTVKSGLQRIKELQTLKSQGYQKLNAEPFKIDTNTANSGIYENTPAESKADSNFEQDDEYLNNIREKKYANEAKKAFLEKQQEEERSRIKRHTPQMIDIWQDLCPDSGIFENQPAAQSKDVIRHADIADEALVVDEDASVNGEESLDHMINESR